MKTKIFTVILVSLLIACGKNEIQKKAQDLLTEATTAYHNNQYKTAIDKIDTLRKLYPNAIDTRKQALSLYQDIELKKAQKDLEYTDSILRAITHDYDYQRDKVERDKKALNATAEELQTFTLTRMKRDSIQTQFDLLCAKIHYIHKKQKED